MGRRGRSTKAGARTPATRWQTIPGDGLFGSLNQGRGANPGDTRSPGPASPGCRKPLNEGRGANPGDTPASVRRRSGRGRAQPRPGREPRRHARPRTASSRTGRAQPRPGRQPGYTGKVPGYTGKVPGYTGKSSRINARPMSAPNRRVRDGPGSVAVGRRQRVERHKRPAPAVFMQPGRLPRSEPMGAAVPRRRSTVRSAVRVACGRNPSSSSVPLRFLCRRPRRALARGFEARQHRTGGGEVFPGSNGWGPGSVAGRSRGRASRNT